MSRNLIIGGILLSVVAVIPLVSPWTTVMLTIALGTGLSVLGIMILLRAGQVSFGHGLFFAASAYTIAFLVRAKLDLDATVLLLAGACVSLVISIIVGFFVVRYRDIFFGMLNLAMSMVLYSLLEKLYSVTRGSDGLHVDRPTLGGFVLERAQFELRLFYLTLACSILICLAVARYLQSPIGKALEAIKSNETRLEYLGVSSRRVLHVAYAISALLAGIGGGVFALVTGHVTPELAYWVRSGEFVFIAILGGAGNVVGAFVGALTYEVVRNYAAAIAAEYWQSVLGTALLLIIMFAPEGLVGLARAKRGARL